MYTVLNAHNNLLIKKWSTVYGSAKYLWSKKTRRGNGLRGRRLQPHLTLCLVLLSPSFLSSSVSPSLLSLLTLLLLLVALLWWRRENSSFIRRQDDDKGKDSSGYGSRDSLVSSDREKEGSAYRRTRSDLSAELISRANADAYMEDRKSSRSSKWVLVFLAACRRPIL